MSNHESDAPWGVVHTRPFKELMVASLMESNLHLEVTLLEVMRTQRNVRRPTLLFPRYLFVRSRSGKLETTRINRTPGVIRLLSWEEDIQVILHAVVEALRRRVGAINAQGGLVSHPYQLGDRVRLTGGPLAGLEAVFQGPMTPSQRVSVLLTFLGQVQAVQVDVDQLDLVRPNPQRRTRGGGRRIRNR